MSRSHSQPSANRRWIVAIASIAAVESAVAFAPETPPGLTGWARVALVALPVTALVVAIFWFAVVQPIRWGTPGELDRARAIVETSSDAIVAVSEEGRVEFFNPAAVRMFGWSEAEVLGQSFEILIAPSERQRHLQIFSDNIRDPAGRFPRALGEVTSIRRDGSLFTADLTLGLMGSGRRRAVVAMLRDVTERRQAEELARAQASTFRALIENCTDVLSLVSSDGKFLFISPVFDRVLGFRASEWLGRSIFDLVRPEDRANAAGLFARAMARPGEPISWQLRLRHADGSLRWMEGTGINRIADSAVGGLVVDCHDVTARKEAEERIRSLMHAIEQSPVSIFITDATGAIEYVNPRFCAVTGYQAHEVYGANPRILKSGETPAAVYRHLWSTILSGGEWRGELRNRRKNGELYWEQASISPILDDEGKIVRFVAVKEDVTERKRTEQELIDSARMLLTSQRVAWLGSYRFTAATGTWTGSPVLDEIFGIPGDFRRDMDGWLAIVHPEDRETMRDYFQNVVLDRRERFDHEYRIVRPCDGEERWVHALGEPTLDAAGELVALIGTIQDITQRKRSQEALAHHALELERANQQLRHEKLEREKVETELRLAQKLEAIGQLAAGIAHEINTPMQYIGDSARFLVNAFGGVTKALDAYQGVVAPLSGVAEYQKPLAHLATTLDQADLEFARGEIPRALDRVLEGTARVTGIVRAMREFAHPDLQERVASDLNRMLLTTLTVARNEYKHVADVETDLGDLPPVLCNVGELNQVFLNILVNAAHAVGDVVAQTRNKGRIVVRTCRDGDAVVVEIEDTGSGIPEAARPRVFDPFFTTKPVGKGTGQGLAIARSIVVDRHRGSLTFRTEVGRGTTFTIRLPIEDQQQNQEVA